VDWLRSTAVAGEVDAKAYVPRRVYGEYLAARLAQAQRDGHDITCVRANIVDVERTPQGWTLTGDDGRRIAHGAFVVLALGALPPADPVPTMGAFRDDPRYVRNPWAFLNRRDFAPSGEILIVGSGLTALDVVSECARAGVTNPLAVVSRHGRFPQSHAVNVGAAHAVDPMPATDQKRSLREIVALVRAALRKAEAEGVDWRAVLDGLRPHVADLWRGLDAADRQRFLRHVRPLYDPHRHRAPAEVLAHVHTLIASGQLTLLAARVVAIRADDDALEVTLRERGAQGQRVMRLAQVINCAGPAGDYATSDDPLVKKLLERRVVSLDPIGLGFRTLPDGRLLDAQGIPQRDLATIGWPMRGTLFEITAVRELREQAITLAAVIQGTAAERFPMRFEKRQPRV
jgi:uncharacterized NAD(P)/FAD-binding protein YdhS